MNNQPYLSRIQKTLENLWGGVTEKVKGLGVTEVGNVTHSPVPQEVLDQGNPTPTPSQAPMPSVAPGTELGTNFAASQMPPASAQTPEQYYPSTIGNPDFMNALITVDKMRPGLANLLLGIAFNESTLGNTSPNTFGVLPGGEGAGVNPNFQSPVDALNYQVSPNVLGGGANPSMNMLANTGPITRPNVEGLMGSYNPSGSYNEGLLNMLFPQGQ